MLVNPRHIRINSNWMSKSAECTILACSRSPSIVTNDQRTDTDCDTVYDFPVLLPSEIHKLKTVYASKWWSPKVLMSVIGSKQLDIHALTLSHVSTTLTVQSFRSTKQLVCNLYLASVTWTTPFLDVLCLFVCHILVLCYYEYLYMHLNEVRFLTPHYVWAEASKIFCFYTH